MTETLKPEQHEFQAEVRQVLDLMVHSLYSNKEIFLRELISNASDALDKLRFEALSDDSLYAGDAELKVQVSFDKDAGTLMVSDNGIGMSHDELLENLGTIARSGTRKFLDALSGDARTDSNLIGQFGVGFYSAFIVADQVTVQSRRAGDDETWQWVSDGQGAFTLEPVGEDAVNRGTRIILTLKEDESEFLADYRLRSLISKYSDHIAFPIQMHKVQPPPAAEEDSDEDIVDVPAEPEWESVNQASALWSRPRQEIDDDEYKSFYKHVSNDFNDPLRWSHNRVEGNQSFTTLLYLPEKPPFDLMMGREERHGLKLYVRRVFIMDAAEQLLPTYLRFVRGVVDSDDLPLNVSREILQDNALVKKIRASVVKRVLGMLEQLTDETETYKEFWKGFGEVLKEGVVEDFSNQEKLLKLARFASTANSDAEPTTSLDDYLGRMNSGQDKIYYVTADSHQAALNSPHLEVFRKQGIEVLLMSDRVDEWMMGHVREYDGKPFQSVAKGDLDLSNLEDEDAKKQREEKASEAAPLLDRLKKALDEQVEEVKVSNRLTDSPSCIVLAEHDMALHMQQLMKQAGHEMPGSKPSLEINPDHPLVARASAVTDEERFSDWAHLLFEQALLAEGGQLSDPASYVKRVNSLLTASDD
ncbi:MAG: molecular chaperone HtpG [Pseudomonadota bacterium]